MSLIVEYTLSSDLITDHVPLKGEASAARWLRLVFIILSSSIYQRED